MSLFEDTNKNLSELYSFIVNVSTTCNNIWKSDAAENGLDPKDTPFILPQSAETSWVTDLNTIIMMLNNNTYHKLKLSNPLNAGQSMEDLCDTSRNEILNVIEHLAKKYTRARLAKNINACGIRHDRITLNTFLYFKPYKYSKALPESLALFWLNKDALPSKPEERFKFLLHILIAQNVHRNTISYFLSKLGENNTPTQRGILLESILPFLDWYYDKKKKLQEIGVVPPGWAYVSTTDKFLNMFGYYIEEIWHGDFTVFPKPVADDANKKLFRGFLDWMSRGYGVELQPEKISTTVKKIANYIQTSEELRLKITNHEEWRKTVLPKIKMAGYIEQ